MSEKLCVFCNHLKYDRIREWQSDCSGGTDGGYSCAKNHFSEVQPYDLDGVRELYATAQKCKDYDEAGK